MKFSNFELLIRFGDCQARAQNVIGTSTSLGSIVKEVYFKELVNMTKPYSQKSYILNLGSHLFIRCIYTTQCFFFLMSKLRMSF